VVKALGAILMAFAIVACSNPAASETGASAASLAPSATETARPAAEPSTSAVQAESATDLLDCDGPVSEMGGRADEFGPEGAGASPADAFDNWMATTVFGVPRSGYRELGNIGDRYVYAYENEGRAKVIVVISPRFGEMVGGTAFTLEELRTCDPSEYGAAVDLGPDQRVWTHDETGEILIDIAGPGHCSWQSARMLHVSNADGSLGKQYLRDPFGVFDDTPSLLDAYADGVEMPADAAFSGYRTADDLELWFTSEDRAAYVVTPDGVERWPRADPPIGCA
jgi:hypothetical protein